MRSAVVLGCVVLSGVVSSGVVLSGGAQADRLTTFVNPFIGTGGHGHTYPGPSLPFGMIQPGPDTRLTGWDSSSGYHYSDTRIVGFSHTHLSGTGIPDYNDVLLMPTTSTLGPICSRRDRTRCPATRRRSRMPRNRPVLAITP